jgi:hypothetical protein
MWLLSWGQAALPSLPPQEPARYSTPHFQWFGTLPIQTQLWLSCCLYSVVLVSFLFFYGGYLPSYTLAQLNSPDSPGSLPVGWCLLFRGFTGSFTGHMQAEDVWPPFTCWLMNTFFRPPKKEGEMSLSILF